MTGIALCWLVLAQAPGGAAGALAAPIEPAAVTLLRLPRGEQRLLLRDFDGDGGIDLLLVDERGFGLRRLREGGYSESDDAFLAFPSQRMAWEVADLDGDGRSEIVLLLDGRELRSFELDAGGSFGEGRALLATQSYLPRGVTRLPIVRDVDADGRPDVVVPAAGRYRIHLARAEGGFAPPIELAYEADVEFEVGDPTRLDARFAQEIRIPWFRIEDVDGDGKADLVSETPDEVYFHLAGDGLPAAPTWKLDLAALRAEREERRVNLDDLFANVDAGVDWRIEDLDGKAPKDLVLRLGTTVRVHLGAARAGPQGSPDQLLKLSGNLLHFFLRDVEGDALPDLQLVRGPRISLGTVIRWLVLPGSLDFDLFTYVNEGGAFARRPTRQNRVTIEIPRLLGFLAEIDELDALVEQQRSVPARRFGARVGEPERDVVDLRGSSLAIFRGRAPERLQGEAFENVGSGVDELLEELVLRDLDRSGDGGSKSIDLGKLSQWHFSAGAALRDACAGWEPDELLPLAWVGGRMSIHVLRLRGDGPPSFFVIGEEQDAEGEHIVVQILGL